MSQNNITYIDLFAGCGGLSEGFIRNGFKPIAHVEMDEAACNTLKTRNAYHYLKRENKFEEYLSYLKGDMDRTELYSKIPEQELKNVINLPIGAEYNPKIHTRISKELNGNDVDLIIGGPPCQAYSLVGRARSENNMETDPRNYLYIQYAKYLEKYNPKMFVFENVIGLKSAKKGLYLRNMEALFTKKGYKMHLFTVKATDFGVLQNRKRVIIIGWKDDFIPNLPNLEEKSSASPFTVNDLLSDLPPLQAGQGCSKYTNYFGENNDYLLDNHIRNEIPILTEHIARPHSKQDKEIYKIAVEKWLKSGERLDYNDLPDQLKTHKNTTSFIDRFKVVAANEAYSQTIVAHISKDGHYYIHPDIDQNRSLTVREAARLQSFPDDFYFEGVKEVGNRTAAFKQIGNAVPPLMAEKIAEKIKELLCQKKKS